MSRTHELKCWPEHFAAVRRREKTFEVRFNDRDYRAGDTLILREWIPPERWIEQYQGDGYTGEKETVTVTYVLDDPRWCKSGYVVLGLGVERWISVKERLPETGEWVLAISTSGAQRVVEYRGQNRFLCPDGWRFSDVTHWMPLPPPPASETEIKPGDEVVHVDHPEYGVGIVKEISKSDKRAYVRFATPRWGLSFGAYYTLAKLRPAPKEEGA